MTPAAGEVQDILTKHPPGRESLIPVLQDLQARDGYLSEAAMSALADATGISANEIFGVATFYTQFRFKPIGRYHMKVCCGTACHVRGADRISERLELDLKIAAGATTEDGKFSLEQVACFGSCALAPVVVVNDKAYGRMTFQKTERVLKGLK